jgi:DNA-binding NtrC family response regulator
MKLLMAMPWKGNVRELDNMLERAMILGNGEWVTSSTLPRSVDHTTAPLAATNDNLKEAVQAYEKIHIENVLRKTDGDKRVAAEALGMSLSSLYRKLEELEIRLP